MSINDDYPNSKGKIDEDFYKIKILEHRNSPNIIDGIFIELTTRIKGRGDRSLFKELKKFYDQVKDVSASQADMQEQRLRAHRATIKLQGANTERAINEIMEEDILSSEAENMLKKETIAAAKKRIRDLEKEKETKTSEPKEGKRKPTPDEVRDKDRAWTEQKIKDMFAHYGTLDEAIRETYKMEFEKEQEIKESDLAEDVKNEEIYRNKVLYSNLREKINKMQSRRG